MNWYHSWMLTALLIFVLQNKHMIALNLGLTDSFSWFRVHCFNATVTVPTEATMVTPWYCIFDYEYFEIGLSSVQMLLSVSIKLVCIVLMFFTVKMQ